MDKSKPKKDKGIKHDYVCDECGAVAEYNIQNWNHTYSIDAKGNMKEIDDNEGDCNEFFCSECFDRSDRNDPNCIS